jgi:hypothetical protein
VGTGRDSICSIPTNDFQRLRNRLVLGSMQAGPNFRDMRLGIALRILESAQRATKLRLTDMPTFLRQIDAMFRESAGIRSCILPLLSETMQLIKYRRGADQILLSFIPTRTATHGRHAPPHLFLRLNTVFSRGHPSSRVPRSYLAPGATFERATGTREHGCQSVGHNDHELCTGSVTRSLFLTLCSSTSPSQRL